MSIAAATPPAVLLLAAVASLGLLIIAFRARRSTLLATIGLLVGAAPKAGIKFGDFPVPVMLFALGIGLAAVLWWERRRGRLALRGSLCLALAAVLAWLVARLTVLAGAGATSGSLIALTAWFLLPVSIVAFASSRPAESIAYRWALARGLEYGMLVAAVFALVQHLAGIKETMIPGLTIAWGDSYVGKPLVISGDNFDPFSKIPSTYQNGNVLGPVMAFALVTVLYRSVLSRRVNRFDLVLGSFAGLACLLSGSRTVILGLLAAAVLVAAKARPRHVLVGSALAIGMVITAFALQPGLAERFSLDYLLSPKGAGRTDQWSIVLGQGQPYRLLVGTDGWAIDDAGASEGFIGALERVGLVGVLLLGLTLWLVLRQHRFAEWRVPCVVLLIAFAIDSSYLVFPTMFIPFARMWAPMGLAEVGYPRFAPVPPEEQRRDGRDAQALADGARPASLV